MAISITSRSVFARWMAIPGVVALVWAWAGGALGEQPVPSLDTLLSTGVENHPTVVTARAKVALAEAELNSARFEVTRQVIALHGDYDAQVQGLNGLEMQLQAASQNLGAARAAVEKEVVGREVLTDAELKQAEAVSALINAKAQVARLATELQRLIRATVYHYSLAPETVQPPASQPVRPLPGPVVQQMAAALDTAISGVDFTEVPLKDVVAYLQDVAKITITVDAAGGVPFENPVTLKLKDVTLSAALQALEDVGLDTVFVVREYGLLATDKTKAEEQGYVRIRDLGKPAPDAETPKAGKDSRVPVKEVPAPDAEAPKAGKDSRVPAKEVPAPPALPKRR
ncbi:MAG: hypothetical protein NTU94_02510 [Planctomycetota bacterium]|nr:hypothetical protein [Planctomycetota bacterium]